MVIASAIFAKAINNQSDDGEGELDLAKDFDEDSQRLINHLSLDEGLMHTLISTAIELSQEN